MKITEVEAGKKYFHVLALDSKDKFTGKKAKQVLVMRVLEVDVANLRVCASMNGFPAKWYPKSKVSKWKKNNPEEVKIK